VVRHGKTSGTRPLATRWEGDRTSTSAQACSRTVDRLITLDAGEAPGDARRYKGGVAGVRGQRTGDQQPLRGGARAIRGRAVTERET